jgi:putative hemolysin
MIEIVIILILLVLNGFFAMCEIALISSRKSRLAQEAKSGSKGASVALSLLKEPEKFLSTVQVGITLVSIIAGAYGAEAFAPYLEPYIARINAVQEYGNQISFTVIVIVITYFSLIIGELVPKTLALNQPEKITIMFAPFMKLLSKMAYPLVTFLSFSTKIVLKMFLIKRKAEPPVTEEELKYMIDTGSHHGVIEKREGEMLKGVFRFGDKKAAEIMTLARHISWLDVSCTKEQLLTQMFQTAYSKYPVCEGSLNKIVGFLSLTEFLKYIDHAHYEIREHLQEALFFSGNTLAIEVLESFRLKKIHIGFVVDEHGQTLGLITLHDLVENIVGDLPDLDEIDDGIIIKRPDGSLLVDGNIEIDKLKAALKSKHIPETRGYKTLAGFVSYKLQGQLQTGAYFIYYDYKFEIVDMDGQRIDKVLITQIHK